MSSTAAFSLTRFVPPGPVAAAWIASRARNAFIMGPFGSGKTTSAIFKRFRFAREMPVCNDGVIRCKAIVVRDSFRTLEKTTLASWRQWFPADYPGSEWQGGNDRPAIHTLRIMTKRGLLEVVTEFAALGSHRIEDVLRGWEGSFAWMNEADLMDASAKMYLGGRLRPFQGGLLTDEGARQSMPLQLIGDINAPDTDSWIYADFVEGAVPFTHGFKADGGHRLFVQPSGLSSAAENKKNLGRRYYEDLVEQNKGKPWWADRFIHNKFGPSRDGKPVYECFDVTRHMADRVLEPISELPVIIGLDAGLTPAAVFIQVLSTGQILVLDELVPGHGFGPKRFSDMLLTLLADRYARVPRIIAYADPAAFVGADQLGGETTWVEAVSQALGLPIFMPGGGSNEITLRLEAVTSSLLTTIDGRTPGLVVSLGCPKLRKGFVSAYRYTKVRVGNSERFAEVPEKNEASHPHDALQYAVLGHKGRAGVIGEASRAGRLGRAGGGWGDKPAKPREWFDVLG